MPKSIRPLNDLQLRNAKPKEKNYKLRDGEGLYILIKPNGRKIFRLDYVYAGKRNTYTIGDYPQISLAQARKIKYEVKELIKNGIDPNRYKQEQKRIKELEANKKFTSFVIERFIQHKAKEVSKARLQKNYINTFANYITPFIGEVKIDEVTKQDIIKIVKNTYSTKLQKDNRSTGKTYKAREVYRLLKSLFDFAIHNDYTQTNPAVGIDIDSLIPKHKPTRHKAVTNERIKEIYQKICSLQNPYFRLPLQYIALTAVRFGNVANLKWDYKDFDKRVIIYPAEAMKTKNQPFRIPLTDAIVKVIQQAKAIASPYSEIVFGSPINAHKPISDNTLRKVLKIDLNEPEQDLHGFRSSFETIALEHQKEHGCSFEAIEAQLHHNIGSKVTQSYLRSDFLEDRKELLNWWANYLNSQ
ncbi:tyrosine-type recombinase/integrase [Nitratiruptor sp. SB155-2]|uniref:tyrosine-type recombinase/integrase n=1 Tax=Nitratiruptor sp. (strain SB155-2) TaxID=387092 RepID=UPI0001587315|nr:site-specific integrase [Nitratiruptor sp. SB155-2]BAF70440.1 site-specific recombinase, phage integrase family [Nitratiruptor sp. SB155-2]